MITSYDALPLMLTVKDLADVLGIALPSAYDLVKRENFPAIRISGRRIVIPKDALQKWVNHQTERGAQ